MRRLEAPNTLHHVMVRGIERTSLFRDDKDRAGAPHPHHLFGDPEPLDHRGA